MSSSGTSGLTIRRFHAVDGVRLWLSGVIDESFPADAFDNVHGVVVIDLSGIRRITSFGIREWCNALGAITVPDVYFAEVAPCMIPQFAMVAGFSGNGGQILGYQAPYECESCGANATRSFDRRRDSDEVWNAQPPEQPCASCGKTMQFAEIAESHRIALMLSGPLRGHAALDAVADAGAAPPASAAAVPGAVAPAPSGKLRSSDAAVARTKPSAPQPAWIYPFEVNKQVVGDATLLWVSGALDAVAGFRHVGDGLEGEVVIVAPGIIACDDAGATVLHKTIAAAIAGGGRVSIARCAPMLVATLARNLEALTGVSLVSVEHTVSCARCRLDSPYFTTMDEAGARGVFCARCGSACPLANDPLTAAIAKMPAGRTPKWLPALLAAPPAMLKARVRPVARSRWTTPLIALAALVAIGAIAIGGYLVSQNGRHRHRTFDPSAPPAVDEPTPEADEPAAAPTPTDAPHAPTKKRAPAPGPHPRPTAEEAPAAPVVAKPTTRDSRKLGDSLEGRHVGEMEALPSDDAPSLPAQLTRAQLDASMAAARSAVSECHDRFHVDGKAIVNATVTPSGRLRGVEIGGLLAGTPTGQCIERAVARASFPHFSGEAMSVSYSYDLR